MGGVLVFADRLETVAELGMLDKIGDYYGQKRKGESRVIERDLAQEIGDDDPADFQGGDLGGQYPLGAVGELLQVHGGKPQDLGHRDGGEDEIGAAQPEADGADDERHHHDNRGACPDAVPGGYLPVLHEHHRDIGAGPEIGGMPDRVLTGVAAEDVPALSHDGA